MLSRSFPGLAQWITSGSLAAYSCGGSRGIGPKGTAPRSFFSQRSLDRRHHKGRVLHRKLDESTSLKLCKWTTSDTKKNGPQLPAIRLPSCKTCPNDYRLQSSLPPLTCPPPHTSHLKICLGVFCLLRLLPFPKIASNSVSWVWAQFRLVILSSSKEDASGSTWTDAGSRRYRWES